MSENILFTVSVPRTVAPAATKVPGSWARATFDEQATVAAKKQPANAANMRAIIDIGLLRGVGGTSGLVGNGSASEQALLADTPKPIPVEAKYCMIECHRLEFTVNYRDGVNRGRSGANFERGTIV